MQQKKDLSIDPDRVAMVIPVYNHGGAIAGVISQALKLPWQVIVVDDGSTDGTYDLIKSIDNVTVLRHAANRGKGAAILTGFAAAAARADWVITIDADGQHIPEDAWNLLRAVPPGTRPIVVGRRKGMDHDNVPWSSRFGRGFSNFWVRASGGPDIEDTQSGFRLYPLPECRLLNVRARRFQFEVEILARARRRGIPIMEVPVSVVYQPAGERVSHYRGFVDFMRNSATFSRLIFGRIFRLPL
ncbi:MAG: glycosyltransferase family 2 protein [Syntrophaceae bacterium]